jgi:hypothetical protein
MRWPFLSPDFLRAGWHRMMTPCALVDTDFIANYPSSRVHVATIRLIQQRTPPSTTNLRFLEMMNIWIKMTVLVDFFWRAEKWMAGKAEG